MNYKIEGELCRRPQAVINFSRMRNGEEQTNLELEKHKQQGADKVVVERAYVYDTVTHPQPEMELEESVPTILERKNQIAQNVDVYLRKKGIKAA